MKNKSNFENEPFPILDSTKGAKEISDVEQTEDLSMKQEKEISKIAQKISALIEKQGFKLSDVLIDNESKLERECKKIEAKHNINISRKKIVMAAIEQIHNEQGGVFPEKLESKYVDLVAEEVKKEIEKSNDEPRDVIKNRSIELKKKGIDIGRELDQKLKNLGVI